MSPRFELREVHVSDNALRTLDRGGQEPTFFLEKHAMGDWGEQRTELNEQGFRERKIVVSVFRTLRNEQVFVFTNLAVHRTYLDCWYLSESTPIATEPTHPIVDDSYSLTPTVEYTPTCGAESSTDTLTYTPAADKFTYVISDGHGGSIPISLGGKLPTEDAGPVDKPLSSTDPAEAPPESSE